MPVDPRTGRLLPYGPNPFLYQQLARTFTGRAAPEPPAENPLRTRVVRRLRPDLLTGTRGGSMTLADVLRSATGLGSRLFGGGGGLPGVLRPKQLPMADVLPSVAESVASPTTPPATGSPFVDVDETSAALSAPIASLQTPDQAVARDLARMVEEGKITMAEAAARYRQYRFGQ